MNSYNAYKCELCEFDSDSTQTDLSNYYAAKKVSTSATDDSIYVKYNSLQHSRSLYHLFREHERRKPLAAPNQSTSQLLSTIVFSAV